MAESTEKRKSTAIYWALTVVSTIFTVLLLMFADAWFWVGLPFVFTSLALATRGI
jgi:hypothetical protein